MGEARRGEEVRAQWWGGEERSGTEKERRQSTRCLNSPTIFPSLHAACQHGHVLTIVAGECQRLAHRRARLRGATRMATPTQVLGESDPHLKVLVGGAALHCDVARNWRDAAAEEGRELVHPWDY